MIEVLSPFAMNFNNNPLLNSLNVNLSSLPNYNYLLSDPALSAVYMEHRQRLQLQQQQLQQAQQQQQQQLLLQTLTARSPAVLAEEKQDLTALLPSGASAEFLNSLAVLGPHMFGSGMNLSPVDLAALSSLTRTGAGMGLDGAKSPNPSNNLGSLGMPGVNNATSDGTLSSTMTIVQPGSNASQAGGKGARALATPPVVTSMMTSPATSATGGTNPATGKKSRRIKSPHQLAALRSHYAKQPKPKKQDIRALVPVTGLTYSEISRWFRNERHKEKKEKMAMSHSKQSSNSNSNNSNNSASVARSGSSSSADENSGGEAAPETRRNKRQRASTRRSARLTVKTEVDEEDISAASAASSATTSPLVVVSTSHTTKSSAEDGEGHSISTRVGMRSSRKRRIVSPSGISSSTQSQGLEGSAGSSLSSTATASASSTSSSLATKSYSRPAANELAGADPYQSEHLNGGIHDHNNMAALNAVVSAGPDSNESILSLLRAASSIDSGSPQASPDQSVRTLLSSSTSGSSSGSTSATSSPSSLSLAALSFPSSASSIQQRLRHHLQRGREADGSPMEDTPEGGDSSPASKPTSPPTLSHTLSGASGDSRQKSAVSRVSTGPSPGIMMAGPAPTASKPPLHPHYQPQLSVATLSSQAGLHSITPPMISGMTQSASNSSGTFELPPHLRAVRNEWLTSFHSLPPIDRCYLLKDLSTTITPLERVLLFQYLMDSTSSAGLSSGASGSSALTAAAMLSGATMAAMAAASAAVASSSSGGGGGSGNAGGLLGVASLLPLPHALQSSQHETSLLAAAHAAAASATAPDSLPAAAVTSPPTSPPTTAPMTPQLLSSSSSSLTTTSSPSSQPSAFATGMAASSQGALLSISLPPTTPPPAYAAARVSPKSTETVGLLSTDSSTMPSASASASASRLASDSSSSSFSSQ